MVPASTLMYGSIFWSVTRKPRASSSEPIDAAARPLPRDDTTPPVTQMNFGVRSRPPFDAAVPAGISGWRAPAPQPVRHERALSNQGRPAAIQPPPAERGQAFADRRTARHPEDHKVVPAQQRPDRAAAREEPLDP